jgi:hypothetical protein
MWYCGIDVSSKKSYVVVYWYGQLTRPELWIALVFSALWIRVVVAYLKRRKLRM